jgi:predicted nucleotidyltransferase
MISELQKAIVLQHVKKLKPLKVGIFGSYARGENSSKSDLDLLVHLDYTTPISLLNLIAVEQAISDALGIPVDLITEKSLHPLIRPIVEKEVSYING